MPDRTFGQRLGDAFRKMAIGHRVIADGLDDLGLTVDLIPDANPTPPPDPPDPPDPPPPSRSLFGWNLGSCLFWANSRPWRNKALLTSLHYAPGSTINAVGELVAGEALLPIWLTPSMAEPGTYRLTMVGSGFADRTTFELTDRTELQQFNIRLRGDCRGVLVARDTDNLWDFVTPEAVERHRGAGAMRLMDLRRINEPEARNGAHWRNNSAGTPAICEQTILPSQADALSEACGGTPIWWNWHHTDSYDFIAQVCEEFQSLDGDYPIYLEMSNELWGAFPQGAWADAVMGEPNEGRYKWLNKRTREMATIAKGILGERAIIVIGSQCTGPGVTQKVLAGGTGGIDALAIAPYFNWFHEGNLPTTFNAAVTAIRKWTEEQIKPAVIHQKSIALEHGLRLLAYEAGTDLSWHLDDGLRPLYSQLNESDEVAEIYADFMDWWKVHVDDLCLFYSDINHHGYGHWRGERLGLQPRGHVVQDAISLPA
jgi:hypothetical protein